MSPKFMQKIRKDRIVNSKKTNELSENTESLRGSNFKWLCTNCFISYTFLWSLTAIFNFDRYIMNTDRWLFMEELQNIVYHIFSDSQR